MLLLPPFADSLQSSWSRNESVGSPFELVVPADQRAKKIQRAPLDRNISLIKKQTSQTGSLQNHKQWAAQLQQWPSARGSALFSVEIGYEADIPLRVAASLHFLVRGWLARKLHSHADLQEAQDSFRSRSAWAFGGDQDSWSFGYVVMDGWLKGILKLWPSFWFFFNTSFFINDFLKIFNRFFSYLHGSNGCTLNYPLMK